MLNTINPNDYNDSVLNRVTNHLMDLKTSLTAAQLKLFISPPEDILIGDKIFSSQLVLKSLREITKNVDIMEAQLIELKEVNFFNYFTKVIISSFFFLFNRER